MLKKIKKYIIDKNNELKNKNNFIKKFNNKYTVPLFISEFFFAFHKMATFFSIAIVFVFVGLYLFPLDYKKDLTVYDGNFKISNNINKNNFFNTELNKEYLISFEDFYFKDSEYLARNSKNKEIKIQRDRYVKEGFENIDFEREDLKKMISNSLFYNIETEEVRRLVITDLNGNLSYVREIAKTAKGDKELSLKFKIDEEAENIYKIEKENNNLMGTKKEYDYIIESKEINEGDNIKFNTYSWKISSGCYECIKNQNPFLQLSGALKRSTGLYDLIGYESFGYHTKNEGEKINITYNNIKTNAYSPIKEKINPVNVSVEETVEVLHSEMKIKLLNHLLFLIVGYLILFTSTKKLKRKEKNERIKMFLESKTNNKNNVLLLEDKREIISKKDNKIKKKTIISI